MKAGGMIWGYPHCEQQQEITQTAIDLSTSALNAFGRFALINDPKSL